MSGTMYPFRVQQSNENLTDRGALAVLDEYGAAVGLWDTLTQHFPAPGSNRGIAPAAYGRTLVAHLVDGGRFLEDVRQLQADRGFQQLVPDLQVPGPDAIGTWLRRLGPRGQTAAQRCLDWLVGQYVTTSDATGFTCDIDAPLLVAEKGDATRGYTGERGYQPLLAFLSDGQGPCCSYVDFRRGHVSPQPGLVAAVAHTQAQLPAGARLQYLRSDSAGYQAALLQHCHQTGIGYTVTADQDPAVRQTIHQIPAADWHGFAERDGTPTTREWAETVHTMDALDHAFRLVVLRTPAAVGPLFPGQVVYHYWAVATNIPRTQLAGHALLHHHQARGRAEQWIGEAKDGLGLRWLPCGQARANGLYFTLGMLAYSLLKLWQRQVLPAGWRRRTIRGLRTRCLRWVGKVTRHARQVWLQIHAPPATLTRIRQIRDQTAALA